MNSALKYVPSLRTLYWAEPAIRKSFTLMIMGLMLAVGIWWVIKPMPNAAPPVSPSLEALYAPWISAGGIILAALAGIVAAGRYLLVRKTFTSGETIKGTVEEVSRQDTNMHSNTNRMKTTPTYVHYVTIRYDLHGDDYKRRFKLPHSPSTYGIKKDGEVDLMVLESLPRSPLIRAVYLETTGPKSRFLFW